MNLKDRTNEELALNLFYELEACKNHPMKCLRTKHIQEALDAAEKRGMERMREIIARIIESLPVVEEK